MASRHLRKLCGVCDSGRTHPSSLIVAILTHWSYSLEVNTYAVDVFVKYLADSVRQRKRETKASHIIFSRKT